MRVPLTILLCVLGAAGCAAENYIYRPAEQVTATVAGEPASRYAIPPERPQGEVLVSTTGITDIDLGEETEEPMKALHVRFVISNNGGEKTWTLDARDIHIDFQGQEEMSPALVNATVTGLPIITIPPGQKQVVDIYYPLPNRFRGARDVPSFDVLWKVHTDERMVAERTPFDRLLVVPETRATVYYGVGPTWWYDPFFPGPVMLHRAQPPRYFGYPR